MFISENKKSTVADSSSGCLRTMNEKNLLQDCRAHFKWQRVGLIIFKLVSALGESINVSNPEQNSQLIWVVKAELLLFKFSCSRKWKYKLIHSLGIEPTQRTNSK